MRTDPDAPFHFKRPLPRSEKEKAELDAATPPREVQLPYTQRKGKFISKKTGKQLESSARKKIDQTFEQRRMNTRQKIISC